MTPEEEKISQLKSAIIDIVHNNPKYDDNLYLLQWLKGSKLDVGKTETRIRNSIKWRTENNVEELGDQEWDQEILSRITWKLDGVSKDGVAVISNAIANVDWLGIFKDFDSQRHTRFWRKFYLETENIMIANNKDRNKNDRKPLTLDSVQGAMIICDAKNIPYAQLTSPKLVHCHIGYLKELITYYPDCIRTVIFINVPIMMKAVIKLLKAVLEGPNFSVEAYSDDEAVEKHVLSRIDRSQLLLTTSSVKK